MKTRAAVLRQVGLPHPYSQSRPLVIEEVELAPLVSATRTCR
jgi:alcohol dehydrogenase